MTTASRKISWKTILVALVAGLLLPLGPVIATEEETPASDNEVVVGGQDATVNADGGRDAKFSKFEDVESGLVMESFRWAMEGEKNWFQVQAWDASQLDESVRLRAGLGKRLRIRAEYRGMPYRFGSGATSVLGRSGNDEFGTTYRIADFTQQAFQDPDGDGLDFYTDAAETASDNLLVQTLTNDLLTGYDRFGLDNHRQFSSAGLTYALDQKWTLEIDVTHETNDGVRPLGSGTYQRITDVNADAITDFDYYFSTRGVELPAPLDYRTTRLEGAIRYADSKWFLDVRGGASEFENSFRAVTYDNPFWFDGVNATGGSRRGLWEQGRASLEPSNEAWDFTVSGGVNLARRTRLTALVSFGEHSQDDSFLPITTNPATIGTADINRDMVIDALDDPTLAPADVPGIPGMIDGMPTLGTSLDATAETLTYNLALTSRPVKKLDLTARYRSHSYEGQEGILVVPARTEYIESQVKLDFKGDLILHVPLDFTRETIDLEAGYRIAKSFKLEAFARRKSYDYDQYRDTDANPSRDFGSRAVSGTDDDIFGLTAMFGNGGWFSGRATVQTADREFDGAYTPPFSGENTDIRQYDIANRERDAADLQFDFMPDDAVSIGLGFYYKDDDYPDSVYGMTAAEMSGVNATLNYSSPEGLNFFVYVDRSEWDGDMHLRTKCSNCAGFTSWTVPNYDWFSDYTDTTLAFGTGVEFEAGRRTRVDLSAHYVKGEIEQQTRNPGIPLDQTPGSPLNGSVANVALGVDFPDQENNLLTAELRLTRKINDRMSCGLRWRFEDFELKDFQWDGLEPYGSNFLTVDDATRYLFLDSRYRDYTANVAQLFLKIRL